MIMEQKHKKMTGFSIERERERDTEEGLGEEVVLRA